MLEVFLGAYLFQPAALDYSGDTCLNNCAYCFANINKESRAGNLKGAINALYKKEAKTYQDLLLKEGYPICVSNRSDPFTPKNKMDSIGFFTHLANYKGGVFIQTKTGPGMGECIELMGDRKEVVIYITITTLKDPVAKIVEPNTPSPSERLKTAKKYHDAGYLVLVAVNPCAEAWMPRDDFDILLKELKSYGINHICIEMLDIKRARLKRLSQNRIKRMGAAIDTLGQKNQMYVRECTEHLVNQGFQVAKKGMPFRSSIFDDIKSRLGKTMPVMQDFVNHCIDKYGTTGAAVSYSEFENVIAKEGIFLKTVKQNNIRDYLLRSGFVSWKDNQQVHSHKELLRIVWNDPRHKLSVQRHCLFRVIGKGGKPERDENGDVKLWFDGSPYLAKKKEVIEI